MSHTIAAVSTGNVISAIGIIRLTGDDCAAGSRSEAGFGGVIGICHKGVDHFVAFGDCRGR